MNWLTKLFSRPAMAAVPMVTAEPRANQTRRGLIKGLGLALGGGLVAGPAVAAAAAPISAAFSPNGDLPFLGEIMLFAGNFAPRGWAFCEGQLLPISQNSALFALLGNTYGGNGVTTFALPDLRGRGPVHAGTGTAGPGLSPVTLGQVGGSEAVTMLVSQMPTHSHALNVSSGAGTQVSPAGAVLAMAAGLDVHGQTVPVTGYAASANTAAAATAIEAAGGNQPMPIRSPFLGLNYCIALEGIFPSRS